MSITREDEQWHELYENAPADTRIAVDEAWTAVKEVFARHGFPFDTCDHAEALVAAIYRYYIMSLALTRSHCVDCAAWASQREEDCTCRA